MRRVLLVFGTRPEAIKMAPLIAEMKSRPEAFEPVVAVTAQHREMLDGVLAEFGIVPDHDLDIMRHQQTLTDITVAALAGLTPLIERIRPDALLVQGDTTTTLSAALAAFYHKVPVGHVEAGLRTGSLEHPYPEEANRRLTSVVTRWHFAPTATAAEHLRAEGHPAEHVHVTGNTVVDALLQVAAKPYEFAPGRVAEALASGTRIVLVTAHRRENWGEPMRAICEAVRQIATRFPDTHVLFATHRNPRVLETVHEVLSGQERIDLLEPLDYPAFVHLMQAAELILSDSGGVQEEAPTFGRPVLVMREITERPEAIEAGVARLVGADTERIVAEASLLLSDTDAYEAMANPANPFGDGTAARRICDVLERELTPRG
jgi:UDP-N-acetylglucosamine 2-epimerase (non-hydrolysing)